MHAERNVAMTRITRYQHLVAIVAAWEAEVLHRKATGVGDVFSARTYLGNAVERANHAASLIGDASVAPRITSYLAAYW
jgi:pantoate kinase